MEIDLPPGWSATAEQILAQPGLTLVWGGPDSGKSTFCRYVLAQAAAQRVPLAFVDSDLGQAHLGPPGALALDFWPQAAYRRCSLHHPILYFIGQTSPPGRLMEIILGLQQLVRRARRQGVPRILVNTSGLVHGPLAQRLKLAKVEALRPQRLIALARHVELEPLLRPLRARQVTELLCLPVSPLARHRPPEERRRYREARFAAYFQEARPLNFPLAACGWLGFPFGQGEPLPAPELQKLAELLSLPVLHAERAATTGLILIQGRPPLATPPQLQETFPGQTLVWVNWHDLTWRLVGLLDRQFATLALGLLQTAAWPQQEVAILTPLPAGQQSQVTFVRLGRLRLNPSGQEIPAAADCTWPALPSPHSPGLARIV